jgi:hypothetical protein
MILVHNVGYRALKDQALSCKNGSYEVFVLDANPRPNATIYHLTRRFNRWTAYLPSMGEKTGDNRSFHNTLMVKELDEVAPTSRVHHEFFRWYWTTQRRMMMRPSRPLDALSSVRP